MAADAIAKPMVLGDVLLINNAPNIIILNEINEVLIELIEANDYVCHCTNQLNPELLKRPVLSTGISGEDFVVKVAGEEDAE